MALKNQPYIPFYVQDFETDEKLIYCSASATGVYIRIMCHMHKSEKYGTVLLKQNFKQTSKQVKNFALQLAVVLPYDLLTIENALIELVNEKVLIIEGDYLVQKRMVKDNEISLKRSKAGRKGGKITQGKLKKEQEKVDDKERDFAKAKSQANSEYENEYEYIDKDKGGMGEKEIPLEDDFEKVWAMYGRKGNKKTSRRRWDGLPKKARKLAVAHIPLYVDATPEITFRKNFETYINQEAWNDEIIKRNDNRSKEAKRVDADMERLEWLTRKTEQAFAKAQ